MANFYFRLLLWSSAVCDCEIYDQIDTNVNIEFTESFYKITDIMFSFRFFIALCLVLMIVKDTLSLGENAQQTSSGDEQKKALETQNNANNSSTSSVPIVGGSESKINQTWISGSGPKTSFILNKEALIRSFYVFGGLCFLAILYFVFRTCRLRRRRGTARRTGTRKYHPLNAGSGSQEMEPLGDGRDDDEDEDTLFDTSQPSNVAHPTPSFGI